jgi:hypothetical protein
VDWHGIRIDGRTDPAGLDQPPDAIGEPITQIDAGGRRSVPR